MGIFTRVGVAFSVLLLPVAAQSATVVGGNTRLVLSGATTGLDVGLIGATTLVVGAPGLTLNFPISGGMLDPATLAGTIEHAGAGFSFTNGTNTLALSDFVIDTTASLIFGTAALNGTVLGTNLSLFSFDLSTVTVPQLTDLSNPLLDLLVTSTAAGALTTAFGLGDTTGVVVGSAATAPVLGAIPEPQTWALLLIGFGLVGHTVRVRQRVGRVTA